MNEQEEAGFWCRVVEGTNAEGQANTIAVKKLEQLSKLSKKELPHYAAGGCAQGSNARRLLPFRPAAFATACSTGRR